MQSHVATLCYTQHRFNKQELCLVHQLSRSENTKFLKYNSMSEEKLHSYRLTSMEEPTDEMLQAIMEQVAESARESSKRVEAEHLHRLAQIRMHSAV